MCNSSKFPSSGIRRRSCHFGGLWGDDRSSDGSTDPKKVAARSSTKPDRGKTVVTCLNSLYFPVSKRTSPNTPGQVQSCTWPLTQMRLGGVESRGKLKPHRRATSWTELTYRRNSLDVFLPAGRRRMHLSPRRLLQWRASKIRWSHHQVPSLAFARAGFDSCEFCRDRIGSLFGAGR